MRVPTRSAGTRSGVNWSRLKVPPRTSATVLTVNVLARPGTPSSSTWPPARSATSSRSSIPSWPTITRLTSNSADSSASWASRDGSAASSSACRRRSSGFNGSSLLFRLPEVLRVDLGVGSVTELHLARTGVRATFNLQLHGVARLLGQDEVPEIARAGDRLAVDRDDLVARSQLRAGGRAAGRDRVDDGAVAIGRRHGRHAEVGALDLAVRLELRHDLLDRVDRHREADAGVGGRPVGGDLRVHADDAPVAVEQRAAGVAGVDRGVGLHGARDLEAVRRVDLAVERRDDAARR